VQLERLEELERAVLEIDPSTFVRTNGARGHQPVPAVHQFQPPIAGD
jgi:hypothetical protein